MPILMVVSFALMTCAVQSTPLTVEVSQTNKTWGPWTGCSYTCEGQQISRRSCNLKDSHDCPLPSVRTRPCNVQKVCSGWKHWTEWSPCSVKCGMGMRSRSRLCKSDACHGTSMQKQKCWPLQCKGAPEIEMTNITVFEGDSFNLTCKVKGTPIPTIVAWTKDDDILPNTTNLSSYTKKHSERQDSGKYTCQAKNKLGRNEGVAELIVVSISFKKEPKDAHIQINDNFSFKCSIITNPSNFSNTVNMSWLKDSLTLFENDKITKYAKNISRNNGLTVKNNTNGKYHLNIVSAKFSDAGNYTCKAGRKQKTATLEVIVPPKLNLTVTPIKQIYEDQDVVDVKCVARGFPFPKISWFILGNRLNPNDKSIVLTPQKPKKHKDMSKSTTTTSVHFKLNSSFDGGMVKCDASLENVDKKHVQQIYSRNVSFSVEYKPIVVLPMETVVISGKPINISCRIEGNPKPVITHWVKQNKEGNSIIQSEELIIKDAKISDAGLYHCHAENTKGTTNSSTTVRVVKDAQHQNILDLSTQTWTIILGCAIPILMMLIGLLIYCIMSQTCSVFQKHKNTTRIDYYYSSRSDTSTASVGVSKHKRRKRSKVEYKDEDTETLIETETDVTKAQSQSILKKASKREHTNQDYTAPDINANDLKVMTNTMLNAKPSAHMISDKNDDYASCRIDDKKAERSKKAPSKATKKEKKQPSSRSKNKSNKKENAYSHKKKQKSRKSNYDSPDTTEEYTREYTQEYSGTSYTSYDR